MPCVASEQVLVFADGQSVWWMNGDGRVLRQRDEWAMCMAGGNKAMC